MSAIETIALVLIGISVIKMITILISPRAWYEGPVAKLWSTPVVGTLLSLVLAWVVLKYLLVELTIVQVFASMAFTSLLFFLILMPYYHELHRMIYREGQSGMSIFKKSLVGTLAWLALMVWVLVEILG
ncbi:MAG: hypothetical protein WDZ64_00510 [Parcubacteria group bacterium]